MDYTDKTMTLDDGNKYLVIEQVDLDNHTYLYIVNSENEKEAKYIEVNKLVLKIYGKKHF